MLGPELDLHPSATGAKLLTKGAVSSLLVAQGCRRGRDAVAAPLILPMELTPALLLPSWGRQGDMLSPTEKDGASPPAQAGPKVLGGLSSGSDSSALAPEGPGFR